VRNKGLRRRKKNWKRVILDSKPLGEALGVGFLTGERGLQKEQVGA